MAFYGLCAYTLLRAIHANGDVTKLDTDNDVTFESPVVKLECVEDVDVWCSLAFGIREALDVLSLIQECVSN
jgi:hypothetical protein